MTSLATYTYVSNESIDGQLKVIYKLMINDNYNGASKTIKSIISNINFAYIYKCNKKLLSNIIDESYRALIDMTFKRYENAHDRIRNMHYMIQEN